MSLTFVQIEKILEHPLPNSASLHQAWWSNTATHSHADAWMSIGWKTRGVNLAEKRVVFVRNGPSRLEAARRSMPRNPTGRVPESIIIDRAQLRGSALRLLEDYAEEAGGDLSAAIVAILNAMALDRRRQLIDSIHRDSLPVVNDSVDIIRADRDSR